MQALYASEIQWVGLDTVFCTVLYGVLRTVSGWLRLRVVPVPCCYVVPYVCQEHQCYDEADSFIGADIGCLYILLWNADRYVLRGKSLWHQYTFPTVYEGAFVHGQQCHVPALIDIGCDTDSLRYDTESCESGDTVWLQVCRGYDWLDHTAGILRSRSLIARNHAAGRNGTSVYPRCGCCHDIPLQ